MTPTSAIPSEDWRKPRPKHRAPDKGSRARADAFLDTVDLMLTNLENTLSLAARKLNER